MMSDSNILLKADNERGYQMLEVYGVPRKRAKYLSNGIDVLATRFNRAINSFEHQNESLQSQLEAAEKLADAADYLLGVKDYKEQNGKDEIYLENKNSAWKLLRKALANYKSQEREDG